MTSSKPVKFVAFRPVKPVFQMQSLSSNFLAIAETQNRFIETVRQTGKRFSQRRGLVNTLPGKQFGRLPPRLTMLGKLNPKFSEIFSVIKLLVARSYDGLTFNFALELLVKLLRFLLGLLVKAVRAILRLVHSASIDSKNLVELVPKRNVYKHCVRANAPNTAT